MGSYAKLLQVVSLTLFMPVPAFILYPLIVFSLYFGITCSSDAVELEVSLGTAFFQGRQDFYKGVLDSLASSQEVSSESKLAHFIGFSKRLADEFQSLGGYDLGAGADSLRFLWLSTENRSWCLKITGSFSVAQLKKSLTAQGWMSEGLGFSKPPLRLSVKEDVLIILSGLGWSQISQLRKRLSGVSAGWGSLNMYSSFLGLLRVREP